MDKNLRVYLAEMVGTFALVFVGAGAVCSSQLLHPEQLNPDMTGVILIALAEGLIFAAGLALVLPLAEGGPIGFFNPAITLMLWVFKRLDGAKTGALIFVQLLGAALAGGLLRLIFLNDVALTDARLGTPHVNLKAWGFLDITGKALLSGVVTELCLTFILTVVIFGTLIDPRAPKLLGQVGKWLAPLWAGLALVAVVLAGYPLTGAAVNPARWFGTVVWENSLDALSLKKPFADHMVYWLGPILGALLGGALYTTLILPAEEEGAAAGTTTAGSGKAHAGAGSTLFRSRK